MLKKINCVFRPDGIFNFLHLQFDNIKTKSDGSGIKDKRVQSSGNFFSDLYVITNFYNNTHIKTSTK